MYNFCFLIFDFAFGFSYLPESLVFDEMEQELRYFGQMERLKTPEIFSSCVALLLQYKTWFDQRMLYKVDVRSRNIAITEYGLQVMKSALGRYSLTP